MNIILSMVPCMAMTPAGMIKAVGGDEPTEWSQLGVCMALL
jgi:hypothetical protein